MLVGNSYSAVSEEGAVQLPEPLPTRTMKPTRITNRAWTLLQRHLRSNKGIPSGVDATVGFTVNPPGYDCFYSDLFSGHRRKCIGHALPGRYCCHRFGKSSRISGSTQKTSPARKQTPRAPGVILPSTSPEIRKGRRRRAASEQAHLANLGPITIDPQTARGIVQYARQRGTKRD